jgi:uncharacterized membrane protein YdcZ (DUF606 family)
MNPMFLLPVAVGVAVVVQAGINRQLAGQWGLAATATVNSVVVLLLALAVFATARLRPDAVPEIFRMPQEFAAMPAWRLFVPGALGLLVVLGLPWSFERLGALQVILTVLVAQLVASLLWDAWVEGIAAHPLRIAGAMIALGGAALASWKS